MTTRQSTREPEKPKPAYREADLTKEEQKPFQDARTDSVKRVRRMLEEKGCPKTLSAQWETILARRAALDVINQKRGVTFIQLERDAWQRAETRGWVSTDQL